MLDWIWRIPVLIYDFFLSRFLTIPAHLIMMTVMGRTTGTFLDVGCGTGAPLFQIIHPLKAVYHWVVGIDLHPDYTRQAQQLFQNESRVTIHNMDYYNLNQLNTKYGFILFSFSFMLMPDPVKAVSLAKLNLQKGGRIAFLLTLNKKSNSIFKRIKPLIKWITSVDFGNVVLETQFNNIINQSNLVEVKRVRIQNRFNLLLKFFPVYYIETQIRQ